MLSRSSIPRLLIALAFTTTLVPCARAWDEIGHQVVAYIAWQHMTPEARMAANEILMHAPPRSGLLDLADYGGPDRDRVYFMRAAVWPDIVRDRSEPERYEIYHKGPWHYTNIFWEAGPDGRVRERTDLQPADVNILERLSYLETVAGNDFFAKAQRAIALAWLEHLVGDVHQPLHASARVTDLEPEGDRGGNLFDLNGRDNLHWYWDRAVTDAHTRRGGESDAAYAGRIARLLMERHPRDASTAEDFNYAGWVRHSYDVASTEVYVGVERGVAPPPEYKEKVGRIAGEAVALAGYRLASLMNRLFG